MRYYRPEQQLKELNLSAFKILCDVKKAPPLLEKGVELNKKAEELLSGKCTLSTLKEAVDFFIELSLHATVLPNRVAYKNIPADVMRLVEKLRAVSYYPLILQKIVVPLANQELNKVNADFSMLEVMTYAELCKSDFASCEERLNKKKVGYSFVYAVLDGDEHVLQVDDAEKVVCLLEPDLQTGEVIGQPAFHGIARGVVRIVNDISLFNTQFNEGDILVSVSTSPVYLPLMKKAGAIVTDEGGITSHGAILSRELRKPCVIGTKIATRALKNGDYVEVDAEKGIVKKL
ncbi:MAG TPA: PEP-utilizing enzyme [Candidatus Nanoarchaeia archaeon]|nr:PEP-utilizing enzyme [Candidatus Nanoarchaeia archaeon]